MKSRSQFIKKTLASARSLQVDYNILGAPATQNVRNPLPMWALVQQALPKKTVLATVKISATVGGKRKSFSFKDAIPLEKFGNDIPSGSTVEEIIQTIKDHGFIANKGNVMNAIHFLKAQGLVEVSRHTRQNPNEFWRDIKPTVSFCRYMMR